jgi:CO/xanthine dehydrogenase FAD-binding subunit
VLVSGLDFVRDQLLDESVVEKVLQIVDEQIAPFSDLRGSEWYKRRMARVFVKKAVAQLASSAN